MAGTIIDVVDFAKIFKDFISFNNVNIRKDLKDIIFSANDNDFLFVKKLIGSATTILDVKIVDDDMVNKATLGIE